jgi:hypothetical protein
MGVLSACDQLSSSTLAAQAPRRFLFALNSPILFLVCSTSTPSRTPEALYVKRLPAPLGSSGWNSEKVCRATVSFRSWHFFRMSRDSYQLG